MGDSCLIGDIDFNIDPTPMTGFGSNQIGLSLLEKLDIASELLGGDPAYQIILPEHRIDFFRDKESLVKELSREFPELEGEIKSFYDAVGKSTLIADKWLNDHPLIQPNNAKEYLNYFKLTPHIVRHLLDTMKLKKIMAHNTAFKKVIEAQQVLLSLRTNNQASIFSSFQHGASLRGVHFFSRGKQTLFDGAKKKIESAGGCYINGCEALSIKKGQPIEVTYNDNNGVASRIEADNLIVSTKWQNMHLLVDRKKKLNFGDWLRPVKISHYPFTIHLGINPSCLPERMARHVAMVRDVKKDIYDDNLIILESCVDKERREFSPSKVPLSATVFLPNEPDSWSKENLEKKADSILEHIEYFLPFLKENIEFSDIEESIAVSKKQREIINPKYQLRNSFITGFAAKTNKTKFPNVYLTGASLLTDIGFDGEIISGINAANQIVSKGK
jgi:phytoene dehydrogenase-like protein